MLQFPNPLGAAPTSEGVFYTDTQSELIYLTALPILELGRGLSEASPQFWEIAAVPVTPWEHCSKLENSPTQGRAVFSTQHELHQPENTPNSILRDYLIPNKNSLEALKASSAWKPQTAVPREAAQPQEELRHHSMISLYPKSLYLQEASKFSFEE